MRSNALSRCSAGWPNAMPMFPKSERIQVRIGINLGEVIVEGEDRYGEGVNIAARLEQLAEPGDIYVSGKVAKEVEKKLAFGFEPMGEQKVKNIAEPIQVYPREARWRDRTAISEAVRADGPPSHVHCRSRCARADSGRRCLRTRAVERPDKRPVASRETFDRRAPSRDKRAGADKGYFSDAIAEGIITELAQSKTYGHRPELELQVPRPADRREED